MGKLAWIACAASLAACQPADPIGEVTGVESQALAYGTAIEFSDPCRAGSTTTVALVGDVMMHSPLQRQVYASSSRWFSVFGDVVSLVSRADVTYAAFEGPSARGVNEDGYSVADPGYVLDGDVYAGYPRFNANPVLIRNLVSAGFDVVSTANNHSLDRRVLGINRTLAHMDYYGLRHTGTVRSTSTSRIFHAITDRDGFRIAWIGCTYGTNVEGDPYDQVLECWDDKYEILRLIESLDDRDDIDAVFVTPHWGRESTHWPTDAGRRLARQFIEAGALAVIGNHPHVTQPWEIIETWDGREGFVIYSLGNFVSAHYRPTLDMRSSLILYIGLTRDWDGRVTINGIRYIPTFMLTSPRKLIAADRGTSSMAQDSWDLTTDLLGTHNLLDSYEPLVTNPECE